MCGIRFPTRHLMQGVPSMTFSPPLRTGQSARPSEDSCKRAQRLGGEIYYSTRLTTPNLISACLSGRVRGRY